MKRVKAICSAMAALLMMGSALAQGMADRKVDFDLAAQPMPDALNAFAAQTKMRIVFEPQDAQGLVTERLKGHFTPQVALKLLLGSSSLRYEFVDDRTVEIHSSRAADAVSSGEKNEPSELNKTSWTGAPGAFRLAQSDSPAPGTSSSPSTSSSSSTTDVPQDTKGVPLSKIEQVTVTGTRIAGSAPIGSPVLIFDQAAIQRTGVATAQEFLARLPQNFSGGMTPSTVAPGSPIPGQQFDNTRGTAVNLRGLGVGSTLVLVDGRRQAVSGSQAAQYVDISMIPLSAVERVEILLDGASAIYGSDAIGGVINFILRKNYRGAETQLRTGTATQGGGTEVSAAQTVGTGWAGGNALLGYDFYHRNPINAADRGFSAAMIDNGRYSSANLLPQEKTHAAFAQASQSLTERFGVYGALNYSRRNSFDETVDRTFQSSSTYESVNQQRGGTIGATWKFADAWSAELSGGLNKNDLNSVVVDSTGSGSNHLTSDSTLRFAQLKVNGTGVRLPAGPIGFAAGAEYRREALTKSEAFAASTPPEQNFGNATTKSLFAEMLVPIFRRSGAPADQRLALSVAGRYETYDQFDSSFNPKAGLEWLVAKPLKLRASYGESLKTPTLVQLDETNLAYSLRTLTTPNGPVRVAERFGGGNSRLEPETAKTWTVGVDYFFDDAKKNAVHLTWFDIYYKDRILSPTNNDLLALTDPAFKPVRTLRGEVPDAQFDAQISEILTSGKVGICRFLPSMCSQPPSAFGAIVDLSLRNVAVTHDSGLDFLAESFRSTRLGTVMVSANVTYLMDYARQLTRTASSIDQVDTIFNPLALRARVSVGLDRGPISTTAYVNYSNRYTNNSIQPVDSISALTTVDFTLIYTLPASESWLSNLQVNLISTNVFDRDPPNAPNALNNGVTYDPANGDPVGRVVAVSVRKNW